MRKFLKFVHDDNVYCKYYEVVYILFHTGMRISEFCGLTIKDIDLENRIVNIDHQLQRLSDMTLVIEPTKTSAGTRKLPITEDVAKCFQAIIEDSEKTKVEKVVDGYTGFLFVDDKGLPLVAMHWEHRFNHMVKRYNDIYRVQMPNITPHICRHTYYSNMAKSGMNPKTLQYLMGHSDIGVLRGSTFLRDKYTDMSIFCSKSKRIGTSCFAIMAIDDSGKKYVSISGVDIDPSSTSYLMSKLIGTSYVYVDDKEDYYLPGGYKISLKGLRDSVYLTASESKKAKTKAYKRMFSCCERKFVNYLEQGRLHELYVKYPPCYMCERMIDHEEVDKMCKIEIICPESKYYKSVVNKEYDNIAKKALNI